MPGGRIDASNISTDSSESHLDRQLELYSHIQRRAERLIQLLIASTAVIAAFASGGVFEFITSGIQYIQENRGAADFLSSDLPISGLTDLGLPLAAFVSLMGILFLVDSVTWSINILTMPNPGPLLGSTREYDTNLPLVKQDDADSIDFGSTSLKDSKLREHIKLNVKILETSNEYLRRSYDELILGLLCFVFAIALAVGQVIELERLIIAVCFIFLIIGTFTGYIFYKAIKKNMSQIKRSVRNFVNRDQNEAGHTASHIAIYGLILGVGLVLYVVSAQVVRIVLLVIVTP